MMCYHRNGICLSFKFLTGGSGTRRAMAAIAVSRAPSPADAAKRSRFPEPGAAVPASPAPPPAVARREPDAPPLLLRVPGLPKLTHS